MALGIDIYRYQTVTDWNLVKRRGVQFVYVKGSDGAGPAVVRADGQVRGAQSVGLPVGLYHYAQFEPTPERQADVLAMEVKRLGATGLPPALDLESPFTPGSGARDFTRAFLNHLRNEHGFERVMLYGNKSMLTGIRASTLGIPGMGVWLAEYGKDDGQRHEPTYGGPFDIHQYTSVGLLDGIRGRVDLNEAVTNFWEADMPLTKADAQLVAAEVWETQRKHLDPANGLMLPMWIWLVGANQGAWAGATRPFPAAADIDEAELAGHIAAGILPKLQETMRELDGFNEEDAEQLAGVFGRKLAAEQVAAVKGGE